MLNPDCAIEMTCRSKYAVGTGVRGSIHKSFGFGYYYEFITGPLGPYAGTSHELAASYSFIKEKDEKPGMDKQESHIASMMAKIDAMENRLIELGSMRQAEGEIERMKNELMELKIQHEKLVKDISGIKSGDIRSIQELKSQLMRLEERVALLISLIKG